MTLGDTTEGESAKPVEFANIISASLDERGLYVHLYFEPPAEYGRGGTLDGLDVEMTLPLESEWAKYVNAHIGAALVNLYETMGKRTIAVRDLQQE